MRTLWLLRHAKSSWDDPSLPDHERPLAPRGRKAAKRIRRYAEGNGLRPDLVLCSTAVRARDTLERVRPGLGDPTVELDDSIYLASAEQLLDRLAALDDGIARVMIVGHDPGLHDLACLLAPPGPEHLPTGALVELELAIDAWSKVGSGCGSLERLVLPRSLEG